MPKLRFTLFIILLFTSLSLTHSAEGSLSIPNINFVEKDSIDIPIIFKTNNKLSETDYFIFEISHPKNSIYFLKANSDGNNVLIVDSKFNDSSAITKFIVQKDKKQLSDTLIILKALILASNNLKSIYQIDSFHVNGLPPYIKSNSAEITRSRTNFRQNDLRIENAYPNPIISKGFIPFTIDTKSNIRIKLYNIVGTLVCDIPNYSLIPYKLLKEDNATEVLIPNSETLELEKGTYYLQIFPDPTTNSSPHYLILTTENEEKSINLLITK